MITLFSLVMWTLWQLVFILSTAIGAQVAASLVLFTRGLVIIIFLFEARGLFHRWEI